MPHRPRSHNNYPDLDDYLEDHDAVKVFEGKRWTDSQGQHILDYYVQNQPTAFDVLGVRPYKDKIGRVHWRALEGKSRGRFAKKPGIIL